MFEEEVKKMNPFKNTESHMSKDEEIENINDMLDTLSSVEARTVLRRLRLTDLVLLGRAIRAYGAECKAAPNIVDDMTGGTSSDQQKIVQILESSGMVFTIALAEEGVQVNCGPVILTFRNGHLTGLDLAEGIG